MKDGQDSASSRQTLIFPALIGWLAVSFLSQIICKKLRFNPFCTYEI